MTRFARAGLTLIEVMVVFAIIAILIGLLLPAIRRVREPAARMQCANQLKQLSLGLHNFESATGRFPSGCSGPGTTPEERLSWLVAVLPYVEENALFQQFDAKAGYAGNLAAAQTPMKLFLCPEGLAATGDAVTHYVAMSGITPYAAGQPADAAGNGFMGYDRQTPLAMLKDGAANTIALLETRCDLGPWARGGPATVRGLDLTDVPLIGEQRPFGGHSGLTQAAMADGAVRAIRDSIDPKHLAAAITIAGGEPFHLD